MLAQAVVVVLLVDDDPHAGHQCRRGPRDVEGDVHVLGIDAGGDRNLVAGQGIQVIERTLPLPLGQQVGHLDQALETRTAARPCAGRSPHRSARAGPSGASTQANSGRTRSADHRERLAGVAVARLVEQGVERTASGSRR